MAAAGLRTGTPVSQKQILSLLCLPFHHAANAHAFYCGGFDVPISIATSYF